MYRQKHFAQESLGGGLPLDEVFKIGRVNE